MRNFISSPGSYRLAGVILLLLIWKVVSWWVAGYEIVPSPEYTFLSLIKIFGTGNFWPSVGLTISRGLAGFVIALFLSILVGIPAGLNSSFFHFINPLLVTIRSTPVISLILLAIIWFGNDLVPVFIAVLTMFPIICLNIIEGIRNVDKDLLSMASIYKVPRKRLLPEVYLPSVAPWLLSGISNAMGFGWRAIIIGEVLSQPRFGIGTMMQRAEIFLLVNELIAWTVIAIIISYIFELIIRSTEKRTIKWQKF